jgi:ElaB/YqjD/DUF883 family membrane-anchored ribosome-binding protein
MFSGLPKLFDKQFVIGFLVPVLLFVLAADAAWRSWSVTTAFATALWEEKEIGALAIAVAALWFGAMLLMLTNRLIYRLLSGYIWPLNTPRSKRRLAAQQSKLKDRINDDNATLAAAGDDPSDEIAELRQQHNRRLYNFRRAFPRDTDQVLATRFGNAIRVTDRYANRVYGADGVILWPRLVGLISKDMLTQIGDVRAQVDCFVNMTMLAAVFSCGAVVHWGLRMARDGVPSNTADFGPAIAILAGVIVSWGVYQLAIERAVALGEQTRAAYDLALPKLIAALGYAMPADRAGQRELLAACAESFLYFKPSELAWKAPAEGVAANAGGGEPSQENGDD